MIEQRIGIAKRHWPKRIGIVVSCFIALGLAWFSVQYWFTSRELDEMKKPGVAADYDVRHTASQVGKLIALPSGEPAIATVSDEAKLKKQSFFKNAKNGDKVLMYTEARKAILYRPSENKIIEVASIKANSS